MSDSKLPKKKDDVLPAAPISDIGPGDMARLVAYIEAGLPGISAATTATINSAWELYKDGATYSNISQDLMVKKEIFLYLSHKGDWFIKRQEHLAELSSRLIQNASSSEIKNQVSLKNGIDHKRRIVDDLLSYWNRTRDSITKIQFDIELASLAKLLEQQQKLYGSNGEKIPKVPLVNINMGQHQSEIKQTGSNSIDITPKESQGDALERMAMELRDEEKRKKQEKIIDTSDIKEDN